MLRRLRLFVLVLLIVGCSAPTVQTPPKGEPEPEVPVHSPPVGSPVPVHSPPAAAPTPVEPVPATPEFGLGTPVPFTLPEEWSGYRIEWFSVAPGAKQYIALLKAEGAVYTALWDSSAKRLLVPGRVSDPVWHPSGDAVAFVLGTQVGAARFGEEITLVFGEVPEASEVRYPVWGSPTHVDGISVFADPTTERLEWWFDPESGRVTDQVRGSTEPFMANSHGVIIPEWMEQPFSLSDRLPVWLGTKPEPWLIFPNPGGSAYGWGAVPNHATDLGLVWSPSQRYAGFKYRTADGLFLRPHRPNSDGPRYGAILPLPDATVAATLLDDGQTTVTLVPGPEGMYLFLIDHFREGFPYHNRPLPGEFHSLQVTQEEIWVVGEDQVLRFPYWYGK